MILKLNFFSVSVGSLTKKTSPTSVSNSGDTVLINQDLVFLVNNISLNQFFENISIKIPQEQIETTMLSGSIETLCEEIR